MLRDRGFPSVKLFLFISFLFLLLNITEEFSHKDAVQRDTMRIQYAAGLFEIRWSQTAAANIPLASRQLQANTRSLRVENL